MNWKRTIAERRVQLLVLGPQRPPAAPADREFTQVVEIDPANPRWYEKLNKLPQLQLAKARLPRLWKGPLGNDCLQTRPHALGEVAQLNPNADSPDVSWEAYWLPIAAARPAAHPGSRLSERRGADLGHQHRRAERGRGDDAHRLGFGRGSRRGAGRRRPRRRVGCGIA